MKDMRIDTLAMWSLLIWFDYDLKTLDIGMVHIWEPDEK